MAWTEPRTPHIDQSARFLWPGISPWVFVLALLLSSPAFAAHPVRPLRLPIDLLPGQNFGYYRELLVRSLATLNVPVKLPVHGTVPQTRMFRDLDKGITALRPLLQTRRRDCRLTEVPVDLTGGLIGQRIFLVRAADRQHFAHVHSLDELRATHAVAAFGQGWFDIRIWQANHLPYQVVSGDWTRIYAMLQAGNRGFDYFPRGANEILGEAREHADLVIEPHLLLVYHRDFRFYLSSPYARYEPLIEAALKKARGSGLMAHLQQKYWGGLAQKLHLADRQVIHLATPDRPTTQSPKQTRCSSAVVSSGDRGLLKK